MTRTIRDTINDQLEDPSFRAEWEALEPEYQIVRSMLLARERRGMTQAMLSEATGVSQADISRIESGKANPSVKTLKRLAKGLGCRLVIGFA